MSRKLLLIIMCLFALFTSAQNNAFYGVGSGGEHNTGVIFKVDEAARTLHLVKKFDSLPYGNFLPNVEKFGSEYYGVASKGGYKNFGGIFKFNIKNSFIQPLYTFNDSMGVAPSHFLKFQDYLVTIQIRSTSPEEPLICSNKSSCIKYLFSFFKVKEGKLKLEKKFTKQFDEYFISYQISEQGLLILQNSRKVVTLNLIDQAAQQVLNFRTLSKKVFPSTLYENPMISSVSSEGIMKGIIYTKRFVSYSKKFGQTYSIRFYEYRLNLYTKEFSIVAIPKKLNWEKLSSVYNKHYFFNKNESDKIIEETNIKYLKVKQNSFVFAESNWKKLRKLKFQQVDDTPEYIHFGDSMLIYTSRRGKGQNSKIYLIRYDLKKNTYLEAIPTDIIRYGSVYYSEIKNNILSLVTDENLCLIDLKSGKSTTIYGASANNIIAYPNRTMFHSENGNIYGIFGWSNPKKVFSYNIKNNSLMPTKLRFLWNDSKYVILDSCHLFFAGCYWDGASVVYNHCSNKTYSVEQAKPFFKKLPPLLTKQILESSCGIKKGHLAFDKNYCYKIHNSVISGIGIYYSSLAAIERLDFSSSDSRFKNIL